MGGLGGRVMDGMEVRGKKGLEKGGQERRCARAGRTGWAERVAAWMERKEKPRRANRE